MMFKKHIALLLAVVLIFTLCSCGVAGIQETESSTETRTTLPDLEIIRQYTANYTIIRQSDVSSAVVTLCKEFQRAFIKAYPGCGIKLSSDSTGAETPSDYKTDALEILIGATNRIESIKAAASLSPLEYTIRVSGNKLLILGGNDYTTIKALEYFTENLLIAQGESFTVKADLRIDGSIELKNPLYESADLRIMSYNLLFGNENGGARYTKILETILGELPDIIGCQEADEANHFNIINALKNVYTAVLVDFTLQNYTPILYRAGNMTLLASGAEYLDGRATNTKMLNWAVFELKNGTKFGVVNVHGAVMLSSYTQYDYLGAEGRDALINSWNVDNVRQMLEIMADTRKKYGDIPFLFTGDFNFTPDTQAYKNAIASGLYDAMNAAKIEKTTGISSFHGSAGREAYAGSTIDHIFATDNVEIYTHRIITHETAVWASDHFPVTSDISFPAK